MTLATALLRAPHIGVRDLKTHLSERLKSRKPLVVTDHGEPKQVLMPYDDIVELAEILEELNDPKLLKLVAEGRKAIREGFEGIPITDSFNKIRAGRKQS